MSTTLSIGQRPGRRRRPEGGGAAEFFEEDVNLWLAFCAILVIALLEVGRRLRAALARAGRLEEEVSQLKKAEEALRASEERFRILFSDASDAILVMDESTIIDCNTRAEKLYGYRQHELVGMTIDRLCPELLSGEDGDGRETLTRSTIRSFQFKQLRKNGSSFDSEINLGTFKLDGKVLVQAIVRDVSERHRLIAELEAKNEEMERFTYTISHDLKSPLFTVKGYLGYLERGIRDGKTEQAFADLQQIRDAVESMAQLLEELLELSRVGHGLNELQEVDLGELALEAVSKVRGRIEEGGVDLVVDAGLPVVRGDRPRLLELFQNLIENAVKFCAESPEPRVEVGVRKAESQHPETRHLFVRDNGIGIDKRYHEKVFGLFERLDADRDGTGIGLAIVKRVVELHGGGVWVESEGLGKGTTFCFTLPADGPPGPLA